ncbi:MAG: hypothetical protein GX040_06075 [Alcaligenaceae bacterium]|nr:hypothetical protein [Alcaligenaceae bacterium]
MIFTYEKPFAFVDVETTGGVIGQDRLTEIAVIRYDGKEVSTYQTLINPTCHISGFIENLTGISNEMVAKAPLFSEVAEEIRTLLDGHIFVAHNVRFDYSFIKSEFKRIGIDFKAPKLCTVKLSRRLYPAYERHGLDYLVQRHQLEIKHRHRAYGDAHVLLQFWQLVNRQFEGAYLQQVVQELMTIPHLPEHIDPEEIESIPNRLGVYLLYGDNDRLLFVGKGNKLRQRVLSFFAKDRALPAEKSFSDRVRRVDYIECAGELDAFLTEEKLIKQCQPEKNKQPRRRKTGDLAQWPFRGYAVLPENNLKHVFWHWQYLGTVHNAEEISQTLSQEKQDFSHEMYKILVRNMSRLVAL